MRFPSRPVLAASVLAALATSGGTVLTMPDYPADAAEAGSVPAPQAAGPAPAPGESAAEPATVPQVAGPPVTGAQIAGLAVAPARERANALAEQAAAEAAAAAKAAEEERARREAEERENEDDDEDARPPSRAEQWEEFRRELREACEEGRVRGQICRGA